METEAVIDLMKETNGLLRMIAEGIERMSPPLPVRDIQNIEAVFGKENVNGVQVEAWKEEEVAAEAGELAKAKAYAQDRRLDPMTRKRITERITGPTPPSMDLIASINRHCESIIAKQGVSK